MSTRSSLKVPSGSSPGSARFLHGFAASVSKRLGILLLFSLPASAQVSVDWTQGPGGVTVAGDGQTLLMTSTSGGLWASGEGGDHWQTVSSSLPPAVAVRFG